MANRKPIALSAMHRQHVEMGAVMVESDGWQRPARYSSVEDEPERVRRGVGICDISPAGKLRLQGADSSALLSDVLQGFDGLEVGLVSRAQLGEDSDSMNVLVAGLASDDALILTAPGNTRSVYELMAQASADCAHPVDITSALAGAKIAGPWAHRLLAGITQVNISPDAFPNMSCAQGMVAEIHGTILRRDEGSLLSYELYFGREFGEYMWDALLEAGEEHGVTPFGTETLSRLQ